MRRALILSVALLVVASGCWFAWSWFRATEAAVFHNIAVGASEESLVETLTRSGIAFHQGQGEGTTVYSHSDGFVGVYFYFVEGGRVVAKAVD